MSVKTFFLGVIGQRNFYYDSMNIVLRPSKHQETKSKMKVSGKIMCSLEAFESASIALEGTET